MSNKCFEGLNPNKFINTLYTFEVADKQIQKWEEEFMIQNQKQIICWQEESQKLYQQRIKEKELMEEGKWEEDPANQTLEELILFEEEAP